MKDEQHTGLSNNPGESPEGSKGTGSRDVRWTPKQFWLDKWLEYLIGVWNGPEAHQKLWSKCGAANPRAYSLQLIANRCLIKAAPELYEVLADIVQAYRQWNSEAETVKVFLSEEQFKRIDAALAKARGEL